MESPKPGLYRHFKGNLYRIVGIALHTETRERMVVYEPVEGDKHLWVRPESMFMDTVMAGGKRVRRFEFVAGNTA